RGETMQRTIVSLLVFSLAFGLLPARATSVVDVQYLDDLKNCCTDDTNANVRQYSSAITDGGGQFVAGPPDCSDSTDEGVVIRETLGLHPRCWYRQFSGPVHLSWYGVPDAATCWTTASGFPSTCDATAILFNAFAASKSYGDGGVTTDGRSIALLTQCTSCSTPSGFLPPAAEIPIGQYLTCARPPGSRHSWDDMKPDAYWKLPGSLVLDPAYTVFRDQS